MNLVGMKKAVVAQAPHLEMSRPATEPIVERPMSVKVGPPMKRLKKLEGGRRPRSMRDLYGVKVWVPNEPYMAQEIARLPELDGDNLLKA
ncbi:hypothetical protein GW17_00056555, partial [Ensete ventricosum]